MREAEIGRIEASTPQNAGLMSLVSLLNAIQGPQDQRSQFAQEFGMRQQGMNADQGFKERALQMQGQEQTQNADYRDRALQAGTQATERNGLLQLLAEMFRSDQGSDRPQMQVNPQGMQGLAGQTGIPNLAGLFQLISGGAQNGMKTAPTDNPHLDIGRARQKLGY